MNAITNTPPYISEFDLAGIKQGWSAIRRRIAGFSSLTPNWDGEGAECPSNELVESLIPYLEHLSRTKHMPVPDRALATPEGGIILEWQYEDGIIELESALPGEAELMWAPDEGDAKFQHLKWAVERSSDTETLWGGWPYSPAEVNSTDQYVFA